MFRNTSTGIRASLHLSNKQACFLERSKSARRLLIRQLEQKGFRCQIDMDNRVAYLESENEIDPNILSGEFGETIDELSLDDNPIQAMLLNVPDGDVETLHHEVGLGLKIEANVEITKQVPLSKEQFYYLYNYKHEVITVPDYSDVKVKFVDSSQYALQMTGPLASVTLCKEKILQLLKGVFTNKFVFGFCAGLSYDRLETMVEDITKRRRFMAHVELGCEDCNIPDDAERLSKVGEDPYVTVVFNKLEEQRADVIVNNTHRMLNLKTGKLSASLLKSCGGQVQDELKEKYPSGIDNGGFAVSGSGRMTVCQQIYHGALPAFKAVEGVTMESYQSIIQLVYNCLKEASNSDHVTIASPALGTGVLAYPVEDVAYLMYEAVRLFLRHCRFTSIEHIYFVILPSACREMKQVFLACCISQTVDTSSVDGLFFQEGSEMPTLEKLFRVGQTLVKVLNADLKEVCHKSCPELVLWIENGIKDLPRSQTAIDTDSTTSRTVIHSFIEGWIGRELKRAVRRGLERAKKEDMNMLALSVPPKGQDRLRNDPESTTRSILQGVKDSKDSVFVLAVFIPDRDLFSTFITAARAAGYESKKPSYLLALTNLENQIRRNLKLTETGNQALLTVTSDSKETNRGVARKIQENLPRVYAGIEDSLR